MYLKEHYVYAYYDEQGQPYYIGKGIRKRCFAKDHTVGVPPYHRIKKLYEDLSDQQACDIETNLILKYGRQDIGTGILLNRKSQSEPHSPEGLKKISKSQKKLWQDPTYRKKCLDSINLIRQYPEYRKKCSERHKKLWQDPEFRKRLSNTHKKQWQDPEHRKKCSETHQKLWMDPERRKKRSEISQKLWQDPERKKKMSEAVKQSWIRRKNSIQ